MKSMLKTHSLWNNKLSKLNMQFILYIQLYNKGSGMVSCSSCFYNINCYDIWQCLVCEIENSTTNQFILIYKEQKPNLLNKL